MSNRNQLSELTWHDIRNEFRKVNPELADIIDAIDPDPKYTFFKAVYNFGSEILIKGKLFLPDENGLLAPLLSNSFSQKIQEKLGYNIGTNPVSVILKNTAEIFMLLEKHTIPLYGLIPKGKILSTWRVLTPGRSHSPAFLWQMTAGARSFYMLPKISENFGHERLRKKFHLHTSKPLNLIQHWTVFKEIASYQNFKSNWQTSILFFSKKWFDNLNDPRWIPFRDYMLLQAWEGSEFWRNQFVWDIMSSLIQKNRNLRPSPFDADTVKHFLFIALGGAPGFAPALNDEAGPVLELQKIYKEIYQTNYDPIIMQPFNYSLYDPVRPVYYSLQYPSTLEFSPRSSERKSIISELHIISSLLQKYLYSLEHDDLNISGTPLYEVPKLVNFTSFHTDPEQYSTIRNSCSIPAEDKYFCSQLNKKDRGEFPINSPFLKGCVRISSKSS